MNPGASKSFWSKVRQSGDCWIWTAGRDIHGYGKFTIDGRTRGAHRLAYIEMVGEPPSGLVLDHLCRNRACVNPEHLEPVTQRENALRGVGPLAINAAKTHCIRGHEFNDNNTYPVPTGGRACRECRRAAWRRWNTRRNLSKETK